MNSKFEGNSGKFFMNLISETIFMNSKINGNRQNVFTNSKIDGNSKNIFIDSKINGNGENNFINIIFERKNSGIRSLYFLMA